MRNSLRLLAMCFAFCLTALILIACGPSIGAASPDKLTQEQTSDSSNDAENQADETGILTPEPIITDEPITEEQPATPIHNEIPTPEPIITDEPETETQPEEQPDEPVTTNDSDETPPHHEHIYCNWKITKAATCIEPGKETGVCECGAQTTRVIEPHHHYELYLTFAATCTQGGYDIYRCSICDAIKHENPTEPTGHNFDYETFTTEPTCCENGTITHKCHCGETRTETIDALGHDVDPETGYCNRCHVLIEAPQTEEPTTTEEPNGNPTPTIEEPIVLNEDPAPTEENPTPAPEENTTPAIKNLSGSYWYLKSKTENDWTIRTGSNSWAICFETHETTDDENLKTGTYYVYQGSLVNGKFRKDTEQPEKNYHGTYKLLSFENANGQYQYYIELADENYPGKTFRLDYGIKQDAITDKTYYTFNTSKKLFNYTNCSLIFAGYGV